MSILDFDRVQFEHLNKRSLGMMGFARTASASQTSWSGSAGTGFGRERQLPALGLRTSVKVGKCWFESGCFFDYLDECNARCLASGRDNDMCDIVCGDICVLPFNR
jgi:hypothetical protein